MTIKMITKGRDFHMTRSGNNKARDRSNRLRVAAADGAEFQSSDSVVDVVDVDSLAWLSQVSTSITSSSIVITSLIRQHTHTHKTSCISKPLMLRSGPPVRLSTVGNRAFPAARAVVPTCVTTVRSTSHLHSHSRSSDSVSRLSSFLVPTRTS